MTRRWTQVPDANDLLGQESLVACFEPDMDCYTVVVCENECGELEFVIWDDGCEPLCEE